MEYKLHNILNLLQIFARKKQEKFMVVKKIFYLNIFQQRK